VEALLRDISDYCKRNGLAESTFGRLAVNDGKFVHRLRDGGRITTLTLARVRDFLARAPALGGPKRRLLTFVPGDGERDAASAHSPHGAAPIAARTQVASAASGRAPHVRGAGSNGSGAGMRMAPPLPNADGGAKPSNFRFFDNRQKYLLFVHTCSEKSVIAQRVAMELGNLNPQPPAIRIFDAGVGDGTVLTRVMRAMHRRFATLPFYIVGKEISLEDVRLLLEKMPDRFYEHPGMVLVVTNMYYREAPWLAPESLAAASGMVWREAALTGTTSHEFEEQIGALGGFLDEHWRAHVSPASGNPVYERPAVLVLYREDHRFLLDPILPKRGAARADYDLVIASQPYRTRDFKASRVVAPLARALRAGGRLLAVHSRGEDPGLEILQGIWPTESPFVHDRHAMLKATKAALGPLSRHFNFNAYSDARSWFRYDMHALPTEISSSIGTSTLLAAWNAAIYVGQIEDARLEDVMVDRRYLDVTSGVLQRHGGLWFWDESYIISRHRE
jgi:hypothetical protein